MRVLFASQYFTPEVTAAASRVHAFAAGIAARGHEVEVVCEVPSHPRGVVLDDYRGRPVTRRVMDGFRVSYVWVRASPSKTARARILNYASYAVTGAIFGAAMRRADVVVASSPPLPVGVVGAALAVRHRAPWVLDVRDLWPEVAVVVGELRQGRPLQLAERLERRLYRSAEAILTTTEPFKRKVEQRGGEGKVEVIANGTTRTWLDAAQLEPDRSELNLPEDRFVWTYAGNLGLAQGLGSAIEAAARLGDRFQLLLLGDGPVKDSLRLQAADLSPGAVNFHDGVPAEEAARYMRASDALLVPLGSSPGLEGCVPSKLFDCCAVGRAVIVAAGGESRRLAEEAEVALCVPPEDPDELASAVRRLRDDQALVDRLSERGRVFAARHERVRGANRLSELLEDIVEAGPTS